MELRFKLWRRVSGVRSGTVWPQQSACLRSSYWQPTFDLWTDPVHCRLCWRRAWFVSSNTV